MKHIETHSALSAEQKTKKNTGILGALRSVFQQRTQRQIDQVDPPDTSLQFTEEQLLEFWINKYNFLQSVPTIAMSKAEKQSAVNLSLIHI